MQIINQKLNSNEVNIIQNWIARTPNIIFYSKAELAKFTSNQVLKIIAKDELVAVCILKNLGWSNRFEEIAILIVSDKYQNQGLAGEIFSEAVKQIRSRNKIIYTTSRNSRIIHLASNLGFEITKLHQLPFEINLDNLGYIFSFNRIIAYFKKMKQFPSQSSFTYLIKK